MRKQYQNKMKKLSKKDRKKFIPPKGDLAENAGFLVKKDSKVVIFYCNCLKLTPPAEITIGNDEEAIKCVNGMGTIQRWTGKETMHRTNLSVPAIIVAYNNYMNSVDRMDHIRSSNPTRR